MTTPKPCLRWALGISMMLVITALVAAGQAQSRKPDVHFVPTPHHVVNEMLRLAGVTKNDVVYDLGSGDGRLVITAAKEFGARGVGVDIDPQRIEESRANARDAGVASRVRFLQQDLFETDISEATVVTLYLLPRLNVKLRPKLLSELRPGTRIVSHDFSMEDWRPDEELHVSVPSGKRTVYYWVVPANVTGLWRWSVPTSTGEQPYTLRLHQRFQEVEGTLSAGEQEVSITNAALKGDDLRFSAAFNAPGRQTTISFDGRVRGNTMQGHMVAESGGALTQHDWVAHRDTEPIAPIDRR